MKRPEKKNYEMRLAELDEKEKELALKHKVLDREKQLGLRPTFKKPAFSKIMMLIMTILCIEIIIYSEVVMWVHYDLSALYAVVGIAAALAASIWSYHEKSKTENSEGGIVYDTAMKKLELENADPPVQDNTDGAEGVG